MTNYLQDFGAAGSHARGGDLNEARNSMRAGFEKMGLDINAAARIAGGVHDCEQMQALSRAMITSHDQLNFVGTKGLSEAIQKVVSQIERQ